MPSHFQRLASRIFSSEVGKKKAILDLHLNGQQLAVMSFSLSLRMKVTCTIQYFHKQTHVSCPVKHTTAIKDCWRQRVKSPSHARTQLGCFTFKYSTRLILVQGALTSHRTRRSGTRTVPEKRRWKLERKRCSATTQATRNHGGAIAITC